MFVPLPELSEDLEWMLQSGQASTEMLAEALVNEFYEPVYRYALYLLDDYSRAEVATRETFVRALTSTYRYRSDRTPLGWILSICRMVCLREQVRLRSQRAIRITISPRKNWNVLGASEPNNPADANLWLAIDTLPEPDHSVILLHLGLDLSIEQTGLVLDAPAAQVTSRLQLALRRLRHLTDDRMFQSAGGEKFSEIVSHSLQRRWPAGRVPAIDKDAFSEEVSHRTQRAGLHGRRSSLLRELIWVGLVILVVGTVFWGVNTFFPEEDPALLATGTIRPQFTPRATSTGKVIAIATQPADRATPAYQATPFPENALYEVVSGDTLDALASRFNTQVEDLRTLNRLPPESELEVGRFLLIPGRLALEPQPTFTPVIPQPTPAVPQDPSIGADPFLQMRTARSRSLWADAQALYYGPEGYLGPPRAYRVQLWLDRERFLILGGPANGRNRLTPSLALMLENEQVWYTNPQLGLPWFVRAEEVDGSVTQPDYLRLFSTYLFPQQRNYETTVFQILGWEEQAGERVLGVDETAPDQQTYRFWFDPYTGFVIRRQAFGDPTRNRLVNEVIVTAFDYDVDFPEDLFDPRLPWRGGYAQDFTGAPETNGNEFVVAGPPGGYRPLPFQTPPPGFDPSEEKIYFQYPQEYNHRASLPSVDVFTDNYYLGPVLFGNPWTMVCDRSLDGANIAFISQPGHSPGMNAALQLFDLRDLLSGVHSPLGIIYASHMAFSPDSRQLAVFGYIGPTTQGGIYIVDLDDGESRLLLELLDAKSFVWKPDGSQLALIGRIATPEMDERVMVIDTQSGEVSYSHSIDFETGNTTDWPVLDWGVDFPVEAEGIEACSEPSK